MLAIAVLLLLHVPPPGVLASVVVEPTQTLIVPVIGVGAAFTVTGYTAIQPVDRAYVILATPAEEPLTTPVVEPTGATDILLLLHVPPTVASLNVITEPIHTEDGPVIATGTGLTVTGCVTKQPVDNV